MSSISWHVVSETAGAVCRVQASDGVPERDRVSAVWSRIRSISCRSHGHPGGRQQEVRCRQRPASEAGRQNQNTTSEVNGGSNLVTICILGHTFCDVIDG